MESCLLAPTMNKRKCTVKQEQHYLSDLNNFLRYPPSDIKKEKKKGYTRNREEALGLNVYMLSEAKLHK